MPSPLGQGQSAGEPPPERPEAPTAIAAHGLEGVAEAPGFVDGEVVEEALGGGVRRDGQRLRESTPTWFRRNATRLSLEASLTSVVESYTRG